MVRGGRRLEKMGRSYIVIEHGKIRGNGGGELIHSYINYYCVLGIGFNVLAITIAYFGM